MKTIIVNETVPSSVAITQEGGQKVSVIQKPVLDNTVSGTRAEVIQTQTAGPQGPAGEGSDIDGHVIRLISDTEPDTSDWEVDDLWLDTSTE